MPRIGLTKEAVVDAAIGLIEEQGHHAYSLNALARRLGIKPASLYNHFENMEELTGAVGYRIGGMIRQTELDAIAGKRGDEALYALCGAYRTFAREHMDLYKVIMGMQKDKNACTEAACGEMIEPILQVLADYGLDETGRMHWQRILRAMMHGFITHEYAGGFRHYPADCGETYRKAIQTIALGIKIDKKESEQ